MGLTLAVNTMCDAVLTCGAALVVLWRLLQVQLLLRSELHVDETIMPCLARGETRKMRLWTYLSSAGADPPIILYHFTPTKEGVHVRDFLVGWRGYLHADAASNYDELYRLNPGIREVGCWAHARRKFFAIAESAPTRVLAHEAVERINALFEIERVARDEGLDAAALKARRAQLAKPRLDEFAQWIQTHLPTSRPLHRPPRRCAM